MVRAFRGKCTESDTDAAMLMLEDGVQTSVEVRGDHHYTLDLERAPAPVRGFLASISG